MSAAEAKALIAAYWDHTATQALFVGCSGGGRQALTEAPRYLTDYDGIVTGTPGVNTPQLSAAGCERWRSIAAIPACWRKPRGIALVRRLHASLVDENGRRPGTRVSATPLLEPFIPGTPWPHCPATASTATAPGTRATSALPRPAGD